MSVFKLNGFVRVDVKEKPGFRPGLKDQVVDPESDVVLNCSVTGYPEPNVHWQDSKHRILKEDGSLVIRNVRKSETYTCFAKNNLGNASISVKVTLSGLPFPPKNIMTKSKSGHTLTVSWEDGESGVQIDYHDMKYRKKGDLYWRQKNIQGNMREYTLRDLVAYTDYEVQVFARNNVGTSKGSAIVVMTTDQTGEFWI